eukprot:scaffold1028_cov135-Cylindrotheca_fusiformis.AAC.15
MCPRTDNEIVGEDENKHHSSGISTTVTVSFIVFCGAVTIASLVAAIVLGGKVADNNSSTPPTIIVNTGTSEEIEMFPTMKPPAGDNICDGTKVDIANVDCLVEVLNNVLPQAGGNVTKGFQGGLEVNHEPIKTPFFQNEMCPVNVHWHLGTEHLSVGEYDEMGKGPHTTPDEGRRALAEVDVRGGFRCHHYDEADSKFTKPYEWKHCEGMEVGETYEVHWPHSAAGACGTVNQFQSPFYDGVFCNVDVLGDFSRLPQQVGVQAQIFTIVNDEDYYYPDLMHGMIVDGEMGSDIAKYTGSTTGTSRDNEVCSAYSPITWQVDRKCHMVSASTFDKMCADMKAQRDDMSEDIIPHGSRELVDKDYVADNLVRKLRGAI